MDRRSFIKLTAISGTSAALASCGNPEHQLIRFVPDEDIVPGIAVVEAERLPAVRGRAAGSPSASWTPTPKSCATARRAS